MQKASVTDRERTGKDKFRDFDLAELAKKTFSMYGGRDEKVTLRCGNELIGVVLDRFGTDVMIVPEEGGYFKAHILVAVSPQFFGWLTGIGDKMHIDGPEHVREEYRKHMERILSKYDGRDWKKDGCVV